MRRWIANVVVNVAARVVDKTFSYAVPDDWEIHRLLGSRVLVPFANRKLVGYVQSLTPVDVRPPGVSTVELKPLLEMLDSLPLLTPDLLALAEFISYRYAATRLQSIETMLPSLLRGMPRQKGKDSGAKAYPVLVRSASLSELQQALSSARANAHWLKKILADLMVDEEIALAKWAITPSHSSVQQLLERGLAQMQWREKPRLQAFYEELALSSETSTKSLPELTSAQQRTLAQLSQALAVKESKTFVLHGVTGSGKTEVYLRFIEQIVKAGGGAIVLVPEIALTPQMVEKFVSRFGSKVALLHSGLSDGERRDEWMRLRRGEACIAVGARSAIFAPVANLRLVVIDEEHEPTYKQEESPRYDTRQVALERARLCQAIVLLGSATPSLYAMNLAETGKARMLSLPQRANGRPLPTAQIIDMREELRNGHTSILSRALQEALTETLARREQTILFLNRRGYASFLLCRHCGEGVECPRCSIHLTLHRQGQTGGFRLTCHYCGYSTPAPERCPACAEAAMRPYGLGTQQVEDTLKELFPTARILRMDVDSTRRKGAHKDLLDKFMHQEADLLIGTQMIAKGLDFPNVTLVGVLNADSLLMVPDYRSEERTFQLLTQVAGRAGRAEKPGSVLIQTYRPEHHTIVAAARQDYNAFYQYERYQRLQYRYPPFCEIAAFLASHQEERYAKGAAERFFRELMRHPAPDGVVVLPASPAGLLRVEDRYRYQVVVKYPEWNNVRDWIIQAFDTVYERMRKIQGVCILDVSAGRIG
ncbi:replication restart helicase PriA [Alicyclobacillus tolerans]|uniref:replication restart helicase PriA n=1 Tax=Alicyclobacillus tolerans TaxID=90970 RepID=UPI003B81A758